MARAFLRKGMEILLACIYMEIKHRVASRKQIQDDVRCRLFLHFEDNKVDIWQDATISSPSASQLISALNLIKTNNRNVIFKSDWEPTQKILERCGGKKGL